MDISMEIWREVCQLPERERPTSFREENNDTARPAEYWG